MMNITVNDIDKMVFVATLPRSGSSMDCGILEICGAFGGKTIGRVPANPKGIFENRGINQLMIRPIMEEIGIKGSKGLMTLARAGGPSADLFKTFKNDLIYGLNKQGYSGGVAYYKNGIFTFFFDRINELFPDAIWLLPERNNEGVVFSNKRIHENRSLDVIDREISDYKEMYSHIQEVAGSRAILLDNDRIIAGDFSKIKEIITLLGLEWDDEAVQEWVDPTMWGDRPEREPFVRVNSGVVRDNGIENERAQEVIERRRSGNNYP
jgi:hypothetical protein